MKKGVILVGEPMGLFIAQNEGPLEHVTGYSFAVAGAEFNMAVGLARLAHHVTYVTKLGEDPFGKRIVHVMNDNHIGTDYVQYAKSHSTGFMLKSRVHKGDPEIFYFRRNSAASTLAPIDIDHIDFSNYKYLHLTGILPALNLTTRATTFHLIELARQNGLTITFDPNLREQLWEDRSTMVQVINEIAAKADIVLPGDKEGEILCGSRNPEEISNFYLKLGVKVIITKIGSRGAFLATNTERCVVEGFTVDKVVDTVGAGDGFATGVVSALLENLSLKQAVRRGNAIGAIQVASRGDNEGLPTRSQLTDFMGLDTL